MNNQLYVIGVISNPQRFKSRINLYHQFAKHMKHSGAILVTVECTYADAPFEVTDSSNTHHIRVSTGDTLWHKENLINIGIHHVKALYPDYQYVAWIDCDVEFVNPNWVRDTIYKLQHHKVVQLFQDAIDLGPDGQLIQAHKGFCYSHTTGKPFYLKNGKVYGDFWHPGFGWAARRDVLECFGLHPLYERAILGAGDHHMALCLISKAKESIPLTIHPHYLADVKAWEQRATLHVKRDIGYVKGLLLHHWHGKKKDRRYVDRWSILTKHQYDPIVDVKRDINGLLQLEDHKWGMRDDIRQYFSLRHEDSIDLE